MRFITLTLGLLLFSSVNLIQAQQSKIEQMERVVDRYLDRNFNTRNPFFTYVGNVEIRSIILNSNGSYSIAGKFDYNNAIGIQVRRSFRATIKMLLDTYSVIKFEFYYPTDIEEKNWEWKEV